MANQLKPVPSEAMERCMFNLAKQDNQESVAEFVARIRKLSMHCNYKDKLDEMLRDKLVCGLRDKDTRVKLFAEKDLTLASALEIATAHEAAVKNAITSIEILDKTSKAEVFSFHDKERRSHQNRAEHPQGKQQDQQQQCKPTQQQRPSAFRNQQNLTCFCCGAQGHGKRTCRYKNSTCNFCGIEGHLEKACLKKAAGSKKSREEIKKFSDSSDSEDGGKGGLRRHRDEFFKVTLSETEEIGQGESDAVCLNALRESDVGNGIINKYNLSSTICKGKNQPRTDDNFLTVEGYGTAQGKPMFLELLINNKKVTLEVDTGTYATVFSEKFWQVNFHDIKVVDTSMKFRAYDDHKLKPIGQIKGLQVKFRNVKRSLNCYVFPGEKPALIGREWLEQFNCWPLHLPPNPETELFILKVEDMPKLLSEKYKELFSDTPGCYNVSKSMIHIKDNVRPIAMKCRHVAHALKPLIEKELDRLVGLGHLEPVEVSEWATPIVAVFKSNGMIRLCGDFKTTINPHLVIDKYPLHTIDDIFTALHDGISFSELDLTHAYMQFPVAEDCRELLTIVTHKGLFRYTKVPEGVSPSPSDIQKKLDECLRGIDHVIAYLDNIYVTGKTDEEHKENLERVCARLQKCGLRLNQAKCKYMQDRIEVLGYVIDKSGLHKAESKVKAMVDAPRPQNSKELASFLGLVNFYARFLEDRSVKLKPLYDLLNEREFKWTTKCESAFNLVKIELTSDRVLALFDPKEQVVLSCDASDYGLSAILSHKYKDNTERPIAYASKKIPKSELKRAIVDKEAMAIVFGFSRFYQFVFGREIILRTDNKALHHILGPNKGIPVTAYNRLQRYAYFLSGFRYKIEHIKSKAKANCDALSRLPIDDCTELPETDFSHILYFEEGTTTFDSKMLASERPFFNDMYLVIIDAHSKWPEVVNCKKNIKASKLVDVFSRLFAHTPHCTTGRSPASLMFGREIRTRFDTLRPSVSEIVDKKQRAQIVARNGKRQIDVDVGDEVMIDNHKVRGDKRIQGVVEKQVSPSTFIVRDEDNVTQKRHYDQIQHYINNNK
ncbi:uncharacterized protein LOC143219479 [Lasioglossum baleicum]|uniref:uncharacterized protein LOC143219479 n=1 Tax=Lasioglossum baleicum TaxID=434251 RepID=UPI003FCD4F5D